MFYNIALVRQLVEAAFDNDDANFAKLRMLGVIYAILFGGVAGMCAGGIIAFSTNESLKLIERRNKQSD